MSRAIDGSKRNNRRAKILKLAKGFTGRRGTNYKAAKDAVVKSLTHAYENRRNMKGDMRSLWVTRINAAVREEGISYSRFIDGLTKAGIIINRKALSNMAIEDPVAFKAVVETAKKAFPRSGSSSSTESRKCNRQNYRTCPGKCSAQTEMQHNGKRKG